MYLSLVVVLLTIGGTVAAESTAVPYPAPKSGWTHAWPYDYTTGVFVDRGVVVESATATTTATATTPPPMVQEILARYQTLLRSKVSANDKFRGYVGMPVLSKVSVKILDLSASGLTLGPDTGTSTMCVDRPAVSTTIGYHAL